MSVNETKPFGQMYVIAPLVANCNQYFVSLNCTFSDYSEHTVSVCSKRGLRHNQAATRDLLDERGTNAGGRFIAVSIWNSFSSCQQQYFVIITFTFLICNLHIRVISHSRLKKSGGKIFILIWRSHKGKNQRFLNLFQVINFQT